MDHAHLSSASDEFAARFYPLFAEIDAATSDELDTASMARFMASARDMVQNYQLLVVRLDESSAKLAYQFSRRYGDRVAELQRALGMMQRRQMTSRHEAR